MACMIQPGRQSFNQELQNINVVLLVICIKLCISAAIFWMLTSSKLIYPTLTLDFAELPWAVFFLGAFNIFICCFLLFQRGSSKHVLHIQKLTLVLAGVKRAKKEHPSALTGAQIFISWFMVVRTFQLQLCKSYSSLPSLFWCLPTPDVSFCQLGFYTLKPTKPSG